MKLLFLSAVVILAQTALALPEDVRYGNPDYKRPLGNNWPDDMRGPKGQKISGMYTVVAPKERWPNATVPWEFDSASNFSDAEKAIILRGMSEIQNVTCIIFVEKTTQTGYITYKNDEQGCWATAGYQGSVQTVHMASDCFGDTSTLVHEVMHAMGFHHEQTRYDRDLYLEVQWDNIEAGKSSNFDKYPRTVAYPKYTYDFNSVMQYTLDSFGIEGRPTMVLQITNSSLDPTQVGKAVVMSRSDVNRIRSAYRCDYQGEGARQPAKAPMKKKTQKKKPLKKKNKQRKLFFKEEEDGKDRTLVATMTLF